MSVGFAFSGWIIMLVVIFLLGVVVRVGTSGKSAFLFLLLLGIGLALPLLYGVRRAGPPRAALVVDEAPMPRFTDSDRTSPPRKPSRPSKSKQPPRPKTSPVTAEADFPPMPPTAVALEPIAPISPPATLASLEAPLTVYLGTSATGKAVDVLPEWATQQVTAGDGNTGSFTLSSDRFATIDEAEKQLWTKARDVVARDLRQRIPDAVGWSPAPELLRSNGFILERCIERTTLEVGQFDEPMYRVHWRAAVSTNVRRAVVEAWRPTMQRHRVGMLAFGLMCVTGAFATMNLVLRGVSSRLASRKTAIV